MRNTESACAYVTVFGATAPVATVVPGCATTDGAPATVSVAGFCTLSPDPPHAATANNEKGTRVPSANVRECRVRSMGVLLWCGAAARGGTPVKCVVDGTPKGKRAAAREPRAGFAGNSLRWRWLRQITRPRADCGIARSCPAGHAAGATIVSGRSHRVRRQLATPAIPATSRALLLLDAVAPHDAQQARMVRQSELPRRMRDVPRVPLERG